ncbi:pleckstrin homology domain-containing family G member 1 isoform X2 [Rhinatrema bivittatum]|uniref:pleckstrin homology domain-containing family G member 1 isoform X2 n=1 Tax=Rhinatrema bivittatum TaxID=194408 RepID=UPI001127713B|nr:pleckstrin homology domain-containing family G member 1 isoform X2 [Rhinatrema bivittatum]
MVPARLTALDLTEMPDESLEHTEVISRNENDHREPRDVLPAVSEVPNHETRSAEDFHRGSRPFRYCGIKTMEVSDSDRPVSFSSTSSSASSRDSHCSFGSRMTLVSNSHLGLFHQDKEAGAIKLELVPARLLTAVELARGGGPEEWNSRESPLKKVEPKGPIKTCAGSLASEPTSPKLLYVDRVVQEILQTERMYVQDLKSIVQDYLDCITNQARLSLGTEERSALFGNIRDIYLFNSGLLQDLENCENDPVGIAECFVSKSEDFHIYTQYCTNYPRSVAVLTECMRNKNLAKFFRERQEVLQHCLPLGAYLLKPVQRILKYHLLLHEIANRLDKDTEGYDVVLEAIDTMQRVAWHINDMKRKHEHAIRLQEIQSLLTNWKGPDLTSYGELVLEGTFRIQRAKNERTLFLFDRLLLITKKREETFTYKAHILCCNLMLVEIIPKEPLSFSVFHYKNPKLQHTVQARSQQDKRLWILHLKRLILENHPAKIPAKAKQAILEMDAIHHPGFYYSSELERNILSDSKERGTAHRVRRKSEPSTRLHKVTKQSEMNPDIQKRISMEGALLSQAAKLASGEALLSSEIRKGVLDHRKMANQSQESLEPAYSSDLDESLRIGTLEQTDADDEEESEQGMKLNSLHKIKGGRKRLNSQAAENVEKRRSINLGTCQTQNSKVPSDEESSQLNAEHPFSCSVSQQARQFNISQGNSVIMNILGGTRAVRNIWTDHQIRQALFPSRQSQEQEDDDDYQMFMPSVSATNLDSTRLQEEHGSSSRPCSWHVGLMHQKEVFSPCRRIVRRASSVGESNTSANGWRNKVSNNSQLVSQRDISSSRTKANAYAVSPEELTIDDLEHVYDNISYEDLKLMGLSQREETDYITNQAARNPDYQSSDKISFGAGPKEKYELQGRASMFANGEEIQFGRDTSSSSSHDLQIVEENIYDTIRHSEQTLLNFKLSPLDSAKRSSFLGLKTDFSCCDNIKRFISEESLQFSEDETLDHRLPLDADYLSLVDSSSNSDSLSHKSVADKLSEEVDEIWNDLENYIKRNEEKKSDRLLAAFPVNKDDVQERQHAVSTPELNKDVEYTLSTLSLPEKPALPHMVKNTATRLSGATLRLEEDNTCKPNSFMSLNRPSFVHETRFAEGTYESSKSILSSADPESADQGLDLVDKTKNRVFMMARQYSQKIKKANQLLKMKSPEHEQSSCKQQKLKPKDLAAILEEKKQGGPAIGARIAEYSQLYDQIVFREAPTTMQKDTRAKDFPALRPTPPLSSTSSHSRTGGDDLQTEDWLLHSTYSNGDLADFFPWPDVQDLKLKYGSSETSAKSTSRQLATACSVPSLKISAQPQVPAQRWSAIVSQPNKENLNKDMYNSLGRTTCIKPHVYNGSQTSSIMINKSVESMNYPSELDKKPLHSSRNLRHDKHPNVCSVDDISLNDTRHHILEDRSDIILQDTQKILVVNKNSPLNAQIATQNYFSNFKDTGADDDDDDNDYVEIRSEDEDNGLVTIHNQTEKSDPKLSTNPSPDSSQNLFSANVFHSFSTPCTPTKTSDSKLAAASHLTSYSESEKLNDYLWRIPPHSQQNIVQSLREKFQCLSSSSFA